MGDTTGWVTHPWVAEAACGVRFGVDVGPAPDGAASVEWAQMVEELGFDSFWLRTFRAFAAAGAQYFVLFVADADTARLLATQVIPEVRAAGPHAVTAPDQAQVDRTPRPAGAPRPRPRPARGS